MYLLLNTTFPLELFSICENLTLIKIKALQNEQEDTGLISGINTATLLP